MKSSLDRGIVVRAYSGFYYVITENNCLFECKLRGRFKQDRYSLLVGDWVEINIVNSVTQKAVIETILPRKTELKRPLVANVDRVIITFAARNPNFDSQMLDRFLILAEQAHLDIVICLNKYDLLPQDELRYELSLYQGLGYPVIPTCAKTHKGIEQLKEYLRHGITVFAGPSGVGKSTLLNSIQPDLKLQTGEISKKLRRGKHTTRYAQLLPITNGGLVVDTPGFSNLEFIELEPAELGNCFVEFNQYESQCRFRQCLHYKEPQCAVKEAVEQNKITEQRYNNYISILVELQEQMRKKYD